MSPRSWSSLFAVIAVAGALCAQGTAVFPDDHTNPGPGKPYLNGASVTGSYPFSSGVSRTMYVYESWQLAIPDGARITQVGFPRDESYTSFGKRIQLQMFMGGTTREASTADREFARNYSAAPVEVYTTKVFDLPNLGVVTTPPVVHEVMVPLDVPYVFPAENLAVEYRVYANANGNQSFSYWLDVARFRSPVTAFGQGCVTSGGALPTLRSRPSAIGQNWVVDLTNAPASTPVMLFLDLQPAPNPIPLAGAPGCFVHVLPLADVSDTTNTGGSKVWSFPLPDNIGLFRAKLASQALAIDLFANAAGIVASNGDEVQFGMDPRATMIYATGSATVQSGYVWRNFGQIALFAWQP
jgi:hypothetical protein